MDEALRLLDLDVADRPSSIDLYFHQPDEAGHYVGIYDDNWVSIKIRIPDIDMQ